MPAQKGLPLSGLRRLHSAGFVLSALTVLVAEGDMGAVISDEVFLTSSIRELMAVVEVDGKAIGAGTPGTVGRAIHEALRRRVGMPEHALRPWERQAISEA